MTTRKKISCSFKIELGSRYGALFFIFATASHEVVNDGAEQDNKFRCKGSMAFITECPLKIAIGLNLSETIFFCYLNASA